LGQGLVGDSMQRRGGRAALAQGDGHPQVDAGGRPKGAAPPEVIQLQILTQRPSHRLEQQHAWQQALLRHARGIAGLQPGHGMAEADGLAQIIRNPLCSENVFPAAPDRGV
jgi:hypothetical protein